MSTARRIGPYEIVREIARGGMGIVYEVRHPSTNRRLALKLVLHDAGPRAQDHARRFEREAEILARCDRHPHVLKVHQLGHLEGRMYLVTELVEGEPLQRELPLDPRRAATIARKLADALAYIHDRGVLHRDVKPDNVLLRAEEADSPVLVDFGLAWVDDVERLTKTGTTLGTPAYMSPEQAGSGSGGKLDPRSDVYSLGATLYASLTGDVPFSAESMSELVLKIMTQPPLPPSEVTKGIPRELDAICLHALEKDPARRYASAAELRDDLDLFLRGEPPTALGLVPRSPRVRALRALAAAVALVAVALAGGVSFQLLRARAQRKGYEKALETAAEASRAAARARRTPEAPATLSALEAALAQLAATRAPQGSPEAPVQRIRLVAALLRAESLARETGGPDERARALERAGKATREYLAVASTLGVSAAASTPEDPEALGDREPALAQALAGWTATEEVARALLARPEPREPSRAARLDRARACLALGDPAGARKCAEAVPGEDSLALDARLVAARACFESADLARARALAQGLVAPSLDPLVRTRGAALLAQIELQRGEPAAADEALAAATDRSEPDVALARAALSLARRAPASVAAAELEALEKRLRETAPLARAHELLGRARLLAAFEDTRPLAEAPRFEPARAALRKAVELGGRPGGGEARGAVARALLELAALDEAEGHAPEASAQRVRAAALAPASVEAALATLDENGSPRGTPPAEAARALDRTAAAVAPEGLAGALRALAAAARTGAAPRTAAGALESAVAETAGAAERGALGLLLARVTAKGGADAAAGANAARALLGRAGALEVLLLDVARERVAFAAHAERYLLHSVALARARDRDDKAPAWGRGAPGEIQDGLAATRGSLARADGAVAVLALDLALALRPTLGAAARERVRALAHALRGARPDLDEAKGLLDAAPFARAFPGADGGVARALRVLAAAESVEPAPLPYEQAAFLLARGRLLVVAGRGKDAVPVLTQAREAATAAGSAIQATERRLFPQLATGEGIFSTAVEEIGLAQSGALDAGGARGDAAQDLDERGAAIVAALAAGDKLFELEEAMGDFGEKETFLSGKVAEQRTATSGRLVAAPLCADVVGKCAASELTAARVIPAWQQWHRYLELRGALPAQLIVLRREFGPHFRKEGAVSQLTVEAVAAAASADDPAELAASAVRALFALPLGPDTGGRRAQALRLEADLARVRELSPGFAALDAYAAFADLAAGEVERARARFARLGELYAHGLRGRKHVQLFAAMACARFGEREETRRVLEELRDGGEVDAFDRVAIRGEAFDDVRALDGLGPILEEIDRRYLGGTGGPR